MAFRAWFIASSCKMERTSANVGGGRIIGMKATFFSNCSPGTTSWKIHEGAVLHVVAKLTEFVSNCLDPLAENGHICASLGDGAGIGM